MEQVEFGTLLREAREERAISLAEVSQKTKVPEGSLRMLEQGRLRDLPPDVFVRGFIRSYAKAVGISDAQPLELFDKVVGSRRQAEELLVSGLPPLAPTRASPTDEEGGSPRHGIGLAVFVILVLLFAITLSLYLRQPPQSGEGLSQSETNSSVERSSVGVAPSGC